MYLVRKTRGNPDDEQNKKNKTEKKLKKTSRSQFQWHIQYLKWGKIFAIFCSLWCFPFWFLFVRYGSATALFIAM